MVQIGLFVGDIVICMFMNEWVFMGLGLFLKFMFGGGGMFLFMIDVFDFGVDCIVIVIMEGDGDQVFVVDVVGLIFGIYIVMEILFVFIGVGSWDFVDVQCNGSIVLVMMEGWQCIGSICIGEGEEFDCFVMNEFIFGGLIMICKVILFMFGIVGFVVIQWDGECIVVDVGEVYCVIIMIIEVDWFEEVEWDGVVLSELVVDFVFWYGIVEFLFVLSVVGLWVFEFVDCGFNDVDVDFVVVSVDVIFMIENLDVVCDFMNVFWLVGYLCVIKNVMIDVGLCDGDVELEVQCILDIDYVFIVLWGSVVFDIGEVFVFDDQCC